MLLLVTLAVLGIIMYIYNFNIRLWKTERKNLDRDVKLEGEVKEPCWLPKKARAKVEVLRKEFEEEHKLQKDTKIILLFTGLFFHPWWWGKNEKAMQRYAFDQKCKVENCYFTYEKNIFLIADIVIFHGVDLNKPYCLKSLSDLRPSQQIWVFFMHESPMYTQDLKDYNGLFNWTMSYMKKSDIFVPYFSFKKRNKEEITKHLSSAKTKKVVWVVSHCDLLRDKYVEELERFIDVDVYGACGVKFKNNMGRCNEWGTICRDEIKQYKFYLAFENCFCKDYITEKFWEKGLKYGLVPVVMGAFDGDSHVIKGSYIDVNDFKSIKQLADYLLYLDKNATAYNEYFQWRQEFMVDDKIDSLCQVCKAAHEDKMSKKVYKNMDKFWSKEENCRIYQWKENQIRKQIALSKFEYNNRRP